MNESMIQFADTVRLGNVQAAELLRQFALGATPEQMKKLISVQVLLGESDVAILKWTNHASRVAPPMASVANEPVESAAPSTAKRARSPRNRKLPSGVFRRKNGALQVRVQVMRGGKMYTRSATMPAGATAQDAEAQRAKLYAELLDAMKSTLAKTQNADYQFVSAIYAEHGSERRTTGQLLPLTIGLGLTIQKGSTHSLGRWMRRHVDQQYGEFRLLRAKTRQNGNVSYRYWVESNSQ